MGRRDGWLLADGMTRSQTSPASHDVGMSLAMVKSCAHDVVTKRCWRHAVLLLVLAALTTLAGRRMRRLPMPSLPDCGSSVTRVRRLCGEISLMRSTGSTPVIRPN